MKQLKLICKVALLFAVITTNLYSCKNNNKETVTAQSAFFTIPFANIIKNKQEVKLSELTDDVELVQLENIPEAMLANVENIEFTSEYFFIKFWQHPVLQFSRNGKFIRNIGAKGAGPGEYNTCMKMSIDELNKRIYIHTAEISMLVFNFEGEHIKTFSYPALGMERFLNFWSRDSMFVSYMEPLMGKQAYVFIEHNELGDTLQTIANHIFWDNNGEFGNLSPFEEQNFTYRFENKLHLKSCYNDTVYTYDENNKIVPKYLIDLGKHKLPEDLVYERIWKRPLPKNLFYTGFHETKDYIFLPYGYHYDVNKPESRIKEKGCVLFNKNSKTGVAIKESEQGGFIDDLMGGPNFRPRVTNDNTALMLVSALDLKQYLNSDQFKSQEVKYPEKKEKLVQLNKTLNEDDNHFVVVVKLNN